MYAPSIHNNYHPRHSQGYRSARQKDSTQHRIRACASAAATKAGAAFTTHSLVTVLPPASPDDARTRPSGTQASILLLQRAHQVQLGFACLEHVDHHGLIVLKLPQRLGHTAELAHRIPGLEHGPSDQLQAHGLGHTTSSSIRRFIVP